MKHRRPSRRGGIRSTVALAVAVLGLAAANVAAADGGGPPVTVISDSVLTSVLWYPDNLAILGQGFTLDMQVAIGRRLAGVSFPFDGVPAPTLMDLVPTLPAVAPTVIVEMGYNDDPAAFPAEAEQAVELLLARGAQRIIWPTLAESSVAYGSMNRDLVALLLAHPQVELADWDRYSQGHDDWFQTDHLHLRPAGGAAIATLLHEALVTPLPANGTTAALPPAVQGIPFEVTLPEPDAAPATWSIAAGALPRGLVLSADGTIEGVPREQGTFRVDALYETPGSLIGTVTLTLAVSGGLATPVLGTPPSAKQPVKRRVIAKAAKHPKRRRAARTHTARR